VSLLADIAQGGVLGLSAAATPGAFQATLVARSVRTGPLRALPLAFIPIVTDPLVIAVVLAALAQVPPAFLRLLTAAGVAVILWIAAGTLRAAWRGAAATAGAPRGFLQAALVNLTTPGAWLFWSLVGGPILTADWRAGGARALAFLGSFYACIVAGNGLLVILAGGIARAGPRAARALGWASGLVLLGYAAWQGWQLLPRPPG
jgi:threonine/homoserine/homoserine lactone efflux protein